MFTRLDRYILRQTLFGTLFAITVLVIVMVLGNIFKEIRPFLVEKGMALSFIGTFIIYLLPFLLVYTIPWSFLASVLLTFGRLSHDQEITAMRTSGRSLYRIALPVILLGTALSLLCLWLNGTASPHAKARLKQAVHEMGMEDPMRFFDPGVVQERLKGQRVYIESRPNDDSLKGFHAYSFSKETSRPLGYLYASDVDFEIDTEKQRFDLRLNNAYGERYLENGQIESAFSQTAEPWILPYVFTRKRRIKPDQLDNAELVSFLKNPPADVPKKRLPDFAYERVRRYSLSFAPLALGFIAMPLALQSRRRANSAGLGLTLIIAFIYFILLSLAKEAQSDNLTLSILSVWVPNILCFILGIWFFRRAAHHS